MTEGHKHRMLHIGHDFDWWPVRLLRKPLWHRFFLDKESKTYKAVDASPYPYGLCEAHHDCYVLTPLGILHRWTGLTLCTWPRPCPVHDPLPDE